jgi:hypothetical protein
MIRTVIGLDPGAATGYAEDTQYGYGMSTIDLGKDQPYGRRLLTLWDALRSRIGYWTHPEEILVCYEQPAMMQGKAGQQIAGYLAVIQLMCEEQGIPSYPVNQSTLKAFVRGKVGHEGKVTKEVMIEAAKVHGAEPGDDNQADAYWLARYGWEMVVPNMGVDT